MNQSDLLHDLLYLDRDYISSFYEAVTGEAATAHFTHQEGKKGGAAIPVFSAELSSVEIKSYNVSSLRMLEKVYPALQNLPVLDLDTISERRRTAFGWVHGKLSAAISTNSKRNADGKEQLLSEERYFTLIPESGRSLALIAADSNFEPGISALTRLQQTVLTKLSLDVRALVRAIPSQTHMDHLVAVPLVILEKADEGLPTDER
jgi:hypothetical protein